MRTPIPRKWTLSDRTKSVSWSSMTNHNVKRSCVYVCVDEYGRKGVGVGVLGGMM